MGKRSDEAARVAAQGLHDARPFPYLYYLHAVSLLRLQSKDYGAIVNDLTLAAHSIPGCSLCYLALSKAHRRNDELGTAMADLQNAVELDPTFAEAWYNLVHRPISSLHLALRVRARLQACCEHRAD